MVFVSFWITVLIVVFGIVRFCFSIYKVINKYSHIPGPSHRGIKGFLLGDIPTIMENDRIGITLHQHLSSL